MLKRTCKPFYGKKNQRLEAAARNATKTGDMELATKLFNASAAILKAKSRDK